MTPGVVRVWRSGAPAIQARQAVVTRLGHAIDHRASSARLAVAAALTVVALVTGGVTWSQRRAAPLAR